jgi:heme-degrading monooxygenase HmoA
MEKILVQFDTGSFDQWLAVFKDSSEVQKSAGLKGYQVYKCFDDPNSVLLLLDWESQEKAKEFMNSQTLRDQQKKAGVISKPESFFVKAI